MADGVLLVLGPSTGGIRRHVMALASHLLADGWDVVTAGPPGVVDPGGRWSHVDLRVPTGPGDVHRLVGARRLLRAAARDAAVVHAHGLKAAWTTAAARTRRPLVATVHNLVLDEASGRAAAMLRRLEGRLPGRVDRVIAVSEEIGRRFAGASNVTVIPPAGPVPVPSLPAGTVRAAIGLGPDDRLLVTVARLHPQKDLPTLLRAVADLDPRVHLAVVGTGPDAEPLGRLAQQLGVAGRVHWLGQRPNPADELAAADAVVISSLWESGPLVLLEAMQLARPVVTTPVGLATSLVGEDGVAGRTVPIGDHGAMARAIDALLGDPEEAARMGERGRAAVTAAHGPDELVKRVADVYREVLGR